MESCQQGIIVKYNRGGRGVRKTISRAWLQKEGACEEGIKWWEAHGSKSVKTTLRRVHQEPEYAEWLVSHLLHDNKPVALKLAVFAAKSCIDNDTGDKTPLINAIKAAEAVIENDNEETRSAAWGAACSARGAASGAARSAESAAWGASCSAIEAWGAACSASAASDAAWGAARSAAWQEILAELIRMIEEGEG